MEHIRNYFNELKDFRKNPGWKYFVFQIILFLILFIGIYIEYTYYPRIARLTFIFAGTLFLVIGLFGLIISVIHYGQIISPFPYPNENAEFRHTGIYALVRHPMYGSLLVMSLGIVFFFNAYFSVIIWIIIFYFFVKKSKVEEKFLSDKYYTYQEYMVKTKRFIPFIY